MPRLWKSNNVLLMYLIYIWKYGRMVHGIVCPPGWELELRPSEKRHRGNLSEYESIGI